MNVCVFLLWLSNVLLLLDEKRREEMRRSGGEEDGKESLECVSSFSCTHTCFGGE